MKVLLNKKLFEIRRV